MIIYKRHIMDLSSATSNYATNKFRVEPLQILTLPSHITRLSFPTYRR
jgi:hypothetical protein